MWSLAHQELLAELCELAGISAQRALLLQSGTLQIGEVACTLAPSPVREDALRIFVCFGQPAPGLNAPAMRRLLEINLLLPQLNGERLALDPDSGNVIFAYQLVAPSAAQLLASMQMVCAQALAWREDHFLEGELA